ncbi:MAG: LamG-like jellyroll fold domain-containing protein, partial [Planctomycetota bacterium]
MCATNTDKVTVANNNGHALSLTVLGGEIEVKEGKALQVDEATTFASGTLLQMGKNTALRAMGGGSIAEMVGIKGDVTIENWLQLDVDNIAAHLFESGTLTKEAPGTLQLNNSGLEYSVYAPYTTFVVEAGLLASEGALPLGVLPLDATQKVILDGGDLSLASAGLLTMASPIEVKQDATITTDASGADFSAALGPLMLDDLITLTTDGSGGVSFESTTIPPGATQVTLKTLQDTSSGPINILDVLDPLIVKKGGADLLVDEAGVNIDLAEFRVDDGTLVGEYGLSNPFGAGDIELDVGNPADGGLTLRNSSGGPVVFANAIEVNGESTLTGDGPDIQLTSPIELWDDLEVKTTGDQLTIAGELQGDDGFRMISGLVLLSGGGGGDDLRIVGGTLTTSTNKTKFSDDIEARGGTLNIGAEMEVGDQFYLENDVVVNTSALVKAKRVRVREQSVLTTGAKFRVTDDLEIDDDAQMIANAQLVVDDDIEVWNNGQLTINAAAEAHQVKLEDHAQVSAVGAGELVVDDYLYQDASGQPRTTYEIDSGTFTATGPDMLNAINLEFGGNKLTVSQDGVGSLSTPPTAGLLGKWTFDDGTADDSSGNGRHGALENGASVVSGALALDGDDDRVTVAGPFPIIDTSFTLAVWAKRDNTSGDYIFGQGDGKGTRNTLHIGFRDDNTFTIAFWGADLNYDSDTAKETGVWHHWTTVYDKDAK